MIMRMKLRLAFDARRGRSIKWPSVAWAPFLLSSTALTTMFAAPSCAVAQTPPTYDPVLQYGLNLIGVTIAWNKFYTGSGVTIAVGDTGIDTTHPAFTGKIDPRSMNFVLPSPDADYDPAQIQDLSKHGTHVTGIALASGASNAPGVAFVVLRVLADTAACKGMNCTPEGISDPLASSLSYFADLNNVRIYNASYGPTLNEGTINLRTWPTYTIDANEAAAALGAISKGKIIVASTGNDRETNPVAGRNPSGLALFPFIQPANANAGIYDDGGNNFNFSALQHQSGLIIGVTSVDEDKHIAVDAQMCSVTASWCVAAPGVDIYSTLPNSTESQNRGRFASRANLVTW
jgi:subtilase-type serine protease